MVRNTLSWFIDSALWSLEFEMSYNPFFAFSNDMSQKWIIFVTSEKRITDINATTQIFLRESMGNPYIKLQDQTFQVVIKQLDSINLASHRSLVLLYASINAFISFHRPFRTWCIFDTKLAGSKFCKTGSGTSVLSTHLLYTHRLISSWLQQQFYLFYSYIKK